MTVMSDLANSLRTPLLAHPKLSAHLFRTKNQFQLIAILLLIFLCILTFIYTNQTALNTNGIEFYSHETPIITEPNQNQPHIFTNSRNINRNVKFKNVPQAEFNYPDMFPNFTSEVEEVLEMQRLDIRNEMVGYQYPAGKYQVQAESLKDLVPEKGGNPVRSVIITTWRSGSTFLGDILGSHPGTMYHYEPLLDYDIIQVRGSPLAEAAIKRLRKLLLCDYSGLEDDYLAYGQDHTWLFHHNSRLWDKCVLKPPLCWEPRFLTPFCRLFPFQTMKVVRLRLSLIEKLLDDKELNIRVLLLVRDPRGTMQSRRHRDWCPGQPDCSDPLRLCADLVADYSAALRLAVRFPRRFKALRYEDLSLEPYKHVKELFEFFGLYLHPNVIEFLDTHTKSNVGGVSSTYRDSKSAPFHWRSDLNYTTVNAIQKVCKPAMSLWGYLPAYNKTHQLEFNPITPSFRLLQN